MDRRRWTGGRSAEEEGGGQEINGKGEEGGGVDGEKFPKRGRAEGDVAEYDRLENRERDGEKSGPDEGKREAKKRRGGEKGEGGKDQSVMKRDDALPRETREKSETLVFDVVGEGGEVEDDEINERQESDGKGKNGNEAVKISRLQNETERGENVADVRGEKQFAKAAADEAERRNGIRKHDEQREREENERGGMDASRQEEKIGAPRRETQQTDGNDEKPVAQVNAFRAEQAAQRLIGGTEDFGQQVHGGLRQERPAKSQREDGRRNGRAEVVRHGGAEGIGKGGEEEMEGAEEGHR